MKRISLVLLIILLALAFTNPDEHQFLEQVARDYGKIHGGMELNISELLHIGESKRTSYILFSLYHYEFGNIGVRYLGIARGTYFIESYRISQKKDDLDIMAYHD